MAEKPNKRKKKAAQTEPAKELQTLPLMALRNLVIFPGMIQSLAVGRPKSLALTQQVAMTEGKLMLVTAQRETEDEDPAFEGIFHVGCTARILKLLKMPDGTQTTIIQGVARAEILELTQSDPYMMARCRTMKDVIEPGKQLDALILNARQLVKRLTELSNEVPDEAAVVVNNLQDPGQIADFLIANLKLNADRKQLFLDELNVRRRLEKAIKVMAQELEVLELAGEIQANVKTSIDKSQREFYLREQMKAIQRELGVEDERARVVADLKDRLTSAQLPDEVQTEADRELMRLESMPTASPDFNVTRTYLEYIADLPWSKSTHHQMDIEIAEKVLDEDHYGLQRVKKRIIEYLAVRKLKDDMKGPILCLVGPPGVGKTSLGRSIARATGRHFIRMSLGGVRDEAEIRGHRRTYVGALPGRIIQDLRKSGANDPVFMLDEVDKLGQDFRGDPTSALLEVLDPEQNSTFTDHYLDVPFDLSRTMFIATANVIDAIPAPLRDRMEVITLPGYTEQEKLEIARRYLVPKTLEGHGLKRSQVKFSVPALRELVNHYTREAGVRNLERQVAAVVRGLAREFAADASKKNAKVTPAEVEQYLGAREYLPDVAERTSVPGVSTGLGWTPYGGDILFIEVTSMKGSGQLIITGQLGAVMRESAQTALSYVRSRAEELNITPSTLSGIDVHVHVPAGAIPKDGPSAGVAIFIAMTSLFTGRIVHHDTAMTGEITLRGMVLPVGGIKEKVIGAARAGIKHIILPDRNKKDLEEVPPEVIKKTRFSFVQRMEDLMPLALEEERRISPGTKHTAADNPPEAESHDAMTLDAKGQRSRH